VRSDIHSPPDLTYIDNVLSRAGAQWPGEHTEIRTDSPLLNRILERSLHDLGIVCSTFGDLSFERISDGVAVKVLKVEGPLDVIIEPEASRASASEAGRI
jgi:hypothetical protein